MQQGVLDGDGNLLGQQGQFLDITRFKRGTGGRAA